MSSAPIGTCTITETRSKDGTISTLYSGFSDPDTVLNKLFQDSLLGNNNDTLRSEFKYSTLRSFSIVEKDHTASAYFYFDYSAMPGFGIDLNVVKGFSPKIDRYQNLQKSIGFIFLEAIGSEDLGLRIIAAAESVLQQFTHNPRA